MGADDLELLVFDWDGTLFDSVESIVACTEATLRELGLPPAGEKRIRGALGLGLRETVDRFVPGCGDDLFRRIVEVYGRQWVEIYHRRAALFGGAREILEGLSAEGYLLGLATAKGRRGLSRDLAATGVESLFAAVRTVDEAPSKPHPQMLIDILDELEVEPAAALMIGDSVHDLEMAGNAGVAAAGVASGSQGREALLAAGALVCLESVLELPSWLAAGGTGAPAGATL